MLAGALAVQWSILVRGLIFNGPNPIPLNIVRLASLLLRCPWSPWRNAAFTPTCGNTFYALLSALFTGILRPQWCWYRTEWSLEWPLLFNWSSWRLLKFSSTSSTSTLAPWFSKLWTPAAPYSSTCLLPILVSGSAEACGQSQTSTLPTWSPPTTQTSFVSLVSF